MAGWHHQLERHEPEQTPGDRERQGSPAYCHPGGHKESVTTQPLSNNDGRLGRRRDNQGGLLRGSDTCKNYQRVENNLPAGEGCMEVTVLPGQGKYSGNSK